MAFELDQIKSKAKTAAANLELRSIAFGTDPHRAFEIAEKMNYPRYECESVMYLAMIKRDHGKGAFIDVCKEAARDLIVSRGLRKQLGLVPSWYSNVVEAIENLKKQISFLEEERIDHIRRYHAFPETKKIETLLLDLKQSGERLKNILDICQK